jgi:anti-sigma regulatory factor (Ser/Thr protein kinase)
MRDETTGAQSAGRAGRAADDEVAAVRTPAEPAAGGPSDQRMDTLAPDPYPDPQAYAEVDGAAERDGSDQKDSAELLPASEVFIEIPADRLYVVLARSAAVHLGAVLHLGITDVTDLRLAVDEACALFLLHPAFPETGAVGLACRFAAYPGELRVTVRAPVPPGFAPDTEAIGWIMLGALVDDLAWTREDGYGTVTLTKRFTPPRTP